MSALPERSVLVGAVVGNIIGFVVTLMATLAGTWNAMGWSPVVVYLLFGLVFAYALIKK